MNTAHRTLWGRHVVEMRCYWHFSQNVWKLWRIMMNKIIGKRKWIYDCRKWVDDICLLLFVSECTICILWFSMVSEANWKWKGVLDLPQILTSQKHFFIFMVMSNFIKWLLAPWFQRLWDYFNNLDATIGH